MIVYNKDFHSFEATRRNGNAVQCKVFSCDGSVADALQRAVEWEASGKKVSRKTPKLLGRKKKKVRRGVVSEPIVGVRKGNNCVVVKYWDRHGRLRKIQEQLTPDNSGEVIQRAYRRAHIMAGCALPDEQPAPPQPDGGDADPDGHTPC